VIAGLRPGRRSAAERIVFDSTGIALADVAAAGLVLDRARAAGRRPRPARDLGESAP
jgi:ornithine cyclodeaminase/alanine dehydrogenase-like protein (mu-crystallin family)